MNVFQSKKFFIHLLGLTVVLASVFLAKVARAESDAVCRQYAQAAVDAFRQTQGLGCPLSNGRWHANYDAHYKWCRSSPTLWVKHEEEYRKNQLLVCRRDWKAVECDKYAIMASGDHRSNLSGGCGFSGGRWHDNYDVHLKWCLANPLETAQNEIKVRFAMLSVCSREPNAMRCDGYAQQAVAQNAENMARACGFGGLRWTTPYEGHLMWCLGQPPSAAEAEAGEREGPLSQCRTTNPLPGPGGPPPEACAWSVIIKNGACLNADGTPSSITPGSLTVTGCGGNQQVALDRAKLIFALDVGPLSEGSSPAPGACTYTYQTTPGCLCQ